MSMETFSCEVGRAVAAPYKGAKNIVLRVESDTPCDVTIVDDRGLELAKQGIRGGHILESRNNNIHSLFLETVPDSWWILIQGYRQAVKGFYQVTNINVAY